MNTYVKALNSGLDKILESDDRVFIIGEDICDPYGGAFKVTKGLSSKYPGRLINTPISESGITGLATGMAIRGLRPILEVMFGDFMSLTVDQVLNNISKLHWMYNRQVKVPIVIRTPMGGRRGYGPTHSQCIEKIFFGMPGIKVVSPSIFHDVSCLLKRAVFDDDPVIFIEYKQDYPRELKIPDNGKIDEWSVRVLEDIYPTLVLSLTGFEDADVTVMTYGGMLPMVESGMKELFLSDEISANILVPSLIKPLNIDNWLPYIAKTGRVVIAEEATLTNGWGAEIAALLADKAFEYLKAPIKRVAAIDLPIANTRSLEDGILPGKQDLIGAVKGIV